jgi:23S rRNA (guanosine2251-2'-O)-methyltransferase
MITYIYGKNVVMQMIKERKPIHQIFVTKSALEGLKNIFQQNHLNYEVVDKTKLDQLTNFQVHQGIVVAVDEYQTYSVEHLVAQIPNGQLGLLVLLDGLEDPHNLGAILRTCDAIGAHGVIYGKHRSVSLGSTVAKVSTGAIDTVPVAEVTNLVQTIKYLKTQGFWIVGSDATGQDYRRFKYDTPIVLVIGSEGKGISRLVKEACDYMIKVPMIGTVTSLNASVAAAVMLYQIHQQRFPL